MNDGLAFMVLAVALMLPLGTLVWVRSISRSVDGLFESVREHERRMDALRRRETHDAP